MVQRALETRSASAMNAEPHRSDEVFADAHAARAEVLLVCDCNYYSRATPPLLATIDVCIAPGGLLLLASRTGRAGLELCVRALDADSTFSCEAVYQFTAEPFDVAELASAADEFTLSGADVLSAPGGTKEKNGEVATAPADDSASAQGQEAWEVEQRDLIWFYRRARDVSVERSNAHKDASHLKRVGSVNLQKCA